MLKLDTAEAADWQTAGVAAKRNRLEWLPGASLCRFGAGSLIGSLLLGKLAASWAFAHTHTAPVRGLSCSMAPRVIRASSQPWQVVQISRGNAALIESSAMTKTTMIMRF